METVRLCGNIAFSLASWVVGLRLVLLSRRTRELPELLIGLTFLLGGGCGYTLAWSLRYIEIPDEARPLVAIAIRLLISCSCGLVLIVAWHVFRPDSKWAAVLVGINLTLLAVYTFRSQITGPLDLQSYVRHPLFVPLALAQSFPFLWSSWETLRYQAQMGRRRRLGLVIDEVLVWRMRFWGWGLGAIGALYLLLSTSSLLRALAEIRLPTAVIIPVVGLASACCLWLAFFPRQMLPGKKAVAADGAAPVAGV